MGPPRRHGIPRRRRARAVEPTDSNKRNITEVGSSDRALSLLPSAAVLKCLTFGRPVPTLLPALVVWPRVVHPYGMNAHTPEPGSPIPSAPFDDLDLEKPEDEAEWDRRVMALAAERIAVERVRLERLGIIDENGELISRALPPDMLPESDTTLETG
jgi:hypothetical protein